MDKEVMPTMCVRMSERLHVGVVVEEVLIKQQHNQGDLPKIVYYLECIQVKGYTDNKKGRQKLQVEIMWEIMRHGIGG